MKTERTFHEVENFTKKALLIRLEAGDTSAVWFPRSRVDFDPDAKTIAATDKLWAEKDIDRNRDFTAEKKLKREQEWDQGKIPVRIGGSLTESGKAVCTHGGIIEEISNQRVNRRFFFPLSQCEKIEGSFHAPFWLVHAKAAETVYDWVSKRGVKGIDHLQGVTFVVEIGGEYGGVNPYGESEIQRTQVWVSFPELKKAEIKYNG